MISQICSEKSRIFTKYTSLAYNLFQFLQDNPNVESFVDWVWDLYAEKENQGHEETKSEYSDVADKKAQPTSKGLLCSVYSCHSDRSINPTRKTF